MILALGGCAGEGSGTSPSTTTTLATAGSSLQQIQDEIFTPMCATAFCHDGTQSPPLTSASVSRSAMVGVESTCASAIMVVAGDSASSYLMGKIGSGSTPCGSLMPLGLPALSSAELDLIRSWIDAGAPAASSFLAGTGATSTSSTTTTTASSTSTTTTRAPTSSSTTSTTTTPSTKR